MLSLSRASSAFRSVIAASRAVALFPAQRAFMSSRNKPKAPMAAHVIYLKEQHNAFKLDNPDVPSTKVVSALVEQFHQLSPGEKQTYIAAAENARAEYHEAMAAYRASLNPRPKPVTLAHQIYDNYKKTYNSLPDDVAAAAAYYKDIPADIKAAWKADRDAANEGIKVDQKAWDDAHASGVELLKDLSKKYFFKMPVSSTYKEARKRRWAAFKEFKAKTFAELPDDDKEKVKALVSAHNAKTKRVIQKNLINAGEDDVAASL